MRASGYGSGERPARRQTLASPPLARARAAPPAQVKSRESRAGGSLEREGGGRAIDPTFAVSAADREYQRHATATLHKFLDKSFGEHISAGVRQPWEDDATVGRIATKQGGDGDAVLQLVTNGAPRVSIPHAHSGVCSLSPALRQAHFARGARARRD